MRERRKRERGTAGPKQKRERKPAAEVNFNQTKYILHFAVIFSIKGSNVDIKYVR
jgi:hypothetical protein